MTWQISAAANGVIGIAYLVIAYIILGGLIRTNQLTTNKLGLATGLIFSYASVLRGAQLFEDMKVRERQALEINDNVVHGLSVAKYALDQGQDEKTRNAVEETLTKARMIITELLGDEDSEVALGPGELRRQRPATVAGSDASS